MRSRAVSLPRERCRSTALLAAALRDSGSAFAKLRDELHHPRATPVEVRRFAFDLRAQYRHRR